MAFNLNLSSQMPQYATAVPDYVQALSKGFDLGMKPRKQSEELLGQMLGNKIKKNEAKYAEQMSQADLSLKQAQAQKALQPAEATGKLANLYKLRASLPVGDARIAQVDEAIKNAISGSNGISIMTDPETGQQMIQIGGSGGKGGSGKLFQTAQGEVLSQPSSATATNLQKRILGAETVEPFVNKIVESLPQFQDPKIKAQTYLQGLSNAYLGTDYRNPSIKAGGKAAVKEASEGMLTQFGLNATGGNREAMEEILTPTSGESANGYKERVQEQLQHFLQNKKYAQRTLGRGITLQKPTIETKTNDVKKDEKPYKTKLGSAKGESVSMYKNGQLYIIPVKEAKEALAEGFSYDQ